VRNNTKVLPTTIKKTSEGEPAGGRERNLTSLGGEGEGEDADSLERGQWGFFCSVHGKQSLKSEMTEEKGSS